jgi:hypothetical protein
VGRCHAAFGIVACNSVSQRRCVGVVGCLTLDVTLAVVSFRVFGADLCLKLTTYQVVSIGGNAACR